MSRLDVVGNLIGWSFGCSLLLFVMGVGCLNTQLDPAVMSGDAGPKQQAGCATNEDCQAWESCQASACIHPCQDHLDCFPGQVCSASQCQAVNQEQPTGDAGTPEQQPPEGSCVFGAKRACYTGPEGTLGKGLCRQGTQTCDGERWGACSEETKPAKETCDGLDNDCDGEIDEGCRSCSNKSLSDLPQGHTGQINHLALHPDGSAFLTVGVDKSIKAWQLSDGQHLFDLKNVPNAIQWIGYLKEGKEIVGYSSTGSLTYWNGQSGEWLSTHSVPTNAIKNTIAIGNEGRWLALGTSNAGVTLWDLNAKKRVRTIPLALVFQYLSLSQDGKHIAIGNYSQTFVIDIEKGKTIYERQHSTSNYGVHLSKDNKTLLLIERRRVSFVDLETGKERRSFTISYSLRSFQISADESLLIQLDYSSYVRLYDLNESRFKTSVSTGNERIQDALVTADGHLLLGSTKGTIRLSRISDSKALLQINPKQLLTNNTLTQQPSGELVAYIKDQREIVLWNKATQKAKETLQTDAPAAFLRFSPDGKTLVAALASQDETRLQFWQIEDTSQSQQAKHDSGQLQTMHFSKDGKTLFTSSEKNTIDVWDVTKRAFVRSLRGHTGPVYALAMTPDGKRFFSGSWDTTIKIWDTATLEPVRTISAHNTAIHSLALSKDGAWMASGDQSGTIHLWSVGQWSQPAKTLTGHQGIVLSLDFRPDGKLLLSGASDGAIRLWDVAEGSQYALLLGHQGAVYDAGFDDSGKVILSAGGDGVRRWQCN